MILLMGIVGTAIGFWIVGGFWGALGGFVMGTMIAEYEEKKERKKQLDEEQLKFFMEQNKVNP